MCRRILSPWVATLLRSSRVESLARHSMATLGVRLAAPLVRRWDSKHLRFLSLVHYFVRFQ